MRGILQIGGVPLSRGILRRMLSPGDLARLVYRAEIRDRSDLLDRFDVMPGDCLLLLLRRVPRAGRCEAVLFLIVTGFLKEAPR